MKTVVGIDLGTQSLKVIFYDFDAREVVVSGSARLDLYQDDNGAAEQQAHWWLSALHDVMDRVGHEVRQSAVAVGVSGQQHGFVPVSESGRVLAPVKLWCDTSTVAECDEIMAAYGGPQKCLDEVGNLIVPGYTASKIRWFAKHGGALYDQLDCILLPHDYLNYYLTGERCMEAGDASGTGLLNIRTRTWSRGMLGAVDPDRDLSQCLPRLSTAMGIIGHVSAEAAQKTGLPEGIPVSTGGGDNMMGAIGTGNVSAGKVTMSLGTSGTVYACSDQPVIDPRGEIAAFCSSTGGWLPLMCTMNCTVTTELMRGVLDADMTSFEAAISQSPRGADGVITLPFFNGERTPNLPNAKACIVGLDGQNTKRENLLRSAMEGATFALRFGVDRLCELGIEADEILLTGGGAGSATWRQVVADVCNAPVTVLAQDQGAGFGAALQALAVLENETDMQGLADRHLARNEALCCEPGKSAVNYYNEAYAKYQEAVETITPLYA
ncbi:MAG: xylulokinase [Xanthomonadales bacterium]|jgi:xylulokinase|nr:xylulokinase [Xanthomonadales bacterium]